MIEHTGVAVPESMTPTNQTQLFYNRRQVPFDKIVGFEPFALCRQKQRLVRISAFNQRTQFFGKLK